MPNQMFRNSTQLFSIILPLKQKDNYNQKRPPPPLPPPLSAALVYSVTRQDPYRQNISFASKNPNRVEDNELIIFS